MRNVLTSLTLTALAFGGCAPVGEAASAPSLAGADCSASSAAGYICGPIGSEDVVAVPGRSLAVASGLALGAPGHLYLVDPRKRTAAGLEIMLPDAATIRPGAQCPGPPDAVRASYVGLALRTGGPLYAVNGTRDTIELFDIDPDAGRAVWRDCLAMPANVFPNALVRLADGTVLLTSFRDPDDPSMWDMMTRGEATGGVWQWREDTGFAPVPGLDRLSGANGIEASADGRTIYISEWAARRLLVYSRDTGAVRTIALDFLPDNIHRQADGSLLVAGQRTQVTSIATCGRDCPQPWVVVHVDPATGKVRTLLDGPGDSLVNYATAATVVDGTLLVTARGDNRLVYTPAGGLGI